MTTQPMRVGQYVLRAISLGIVLYELLFYLGIFLVGTWILGGDHPPGDSLRSIPLLSLEFGVGLGGSITAAWFLKHSTNDRLGARSLALPSLLAVAVFVTALLSPEPTVDGGILVLHMVGVGFLYGIAVGFTALVNLVRRRLEGAGEIQPRLRLPVRRLDGLSFVSAIVLTGLAFAAWAFPAWIQDFNPGQGFDTPARYFSGALPPLFVMLAGLLLPMFVSMPEAPRRSLFWINATAWSLTCVLAFGLAVMAIPGVSQLTLWAMLIVGLAFLCAGWTLTTLFHALYPQSSDSRMRGD